jgi:WS/DGAT/MGAT family acyltransferase
MAARKIPPLDLMFFLTETVQSPKHVGAVQIFKLPPRAPANYMQDLVSAFKEAPVVPPFNYRPSFPRLGMPEWLVEEDIDMDYHVRHSALPKPGTDEQLMEVLQRLHCGLLNRDRPGWICQIIEGLAGGRFAIYSKIHHAYIDGMSGVKRMYGTLSPSPEEMAIVPTWSYQAPAKPGGARQKAGRRGAAGSNPAAAARSALDMYVTMGQSVLDFLQLGDSRAQTMFRAPRTRMNERVEYDTRSIATCTLDLEQAHAIGASMGGKVNDVVLAVVDAALNDYLDEHGEHIQSPLVALCPMSVRREGDEAATTQAAALHVRLGEPDAPVRERLRQVIESSTATKEKAGAMSREALMNLAMVMVGALELTDRTRLGEVFSPSYNVLVSNVPGPREDELYLRGSRHLSSFPISAFLPGANLNITVLSHGTQLDFGLVADKHALPDLKFVARGMEQRFAELEREVLGRPVSRHTRRKSAPARKKSPRKATRRKGG